GMVRDDGRGDRLGQRVRTGAGVRRVVVAAARGVAVARVVGRGAVARVVGRGAVARVGGRVVVARRVGRGAGGGGRGAGVGRWVVVARRVRRSAGVGGRVVVPGVGRRVVVPAVARRIVVAGRVTPVPGRVAAARRRSGSVARRGRRKRGHGTH